MATKGRSVESNPAPDWYQDCFRMALLRVAVTVNGTAPGLGPTLLRQSDEALFSELGKRVGELTRLHVSGYDDYNFDKEYNAENFFYSSLHLANGPAGRKVLRYQLTRTFLDWSRERFQSPRGSDEELERGNYANEQSFRVACATNYLTKNLWHNYVHVALQGITEANYHHFRGEARFDSDFEADNLATLLLIKSYGLPVLARGRPPGRPLRIDALLRRNACNLVFQERAMHRREDRMGKNPLELYQESEWRFFRRICNRLSGGLAAHGLCARTLSVFADGEIRRGRGGTILYPKRNVILEINARRYYTGVPVYVPAEELAHAEIAPARRAAIDAFRNKRVRDIVTLGLAHYGEDVRNDGALADDAADQIASLWRRFGMVAR